MNKKSCRYVWKSAAAALFASCAVTCASAQPNIPRPDPCKCAGVDAQFVVLANKDNQVVIPSLNRGDLIEIRASGEWSYVPDPSRNSGPDGHKPTPADAVGMTSKFTVPEYPLGALIARIGSKGEWLLIGSEKAFSALDAGPLFMQMNDAGSSTNIGSLVVKYRICHK